MRWNAFMSTGWCAMQSLKTDEILTAEFNYIAQTATQANEDRARIAALYFVTVGTLIAAIFGASIAPIEETTQTSIRLAFFLVFLALSAHSLLTILQLVRLRLAWIESVRAMCDIKLFYEKEIATLDIAPAFRWDADTIPPPLKLDSISAILALQVALLGGLAFGSCIFFVCLVLNTVLWLPAILAGFLFLAIETWVYIHMLR